MKKVLALSLLNLIFVSNVQPNHHHHDKEKKIEIINKTECDCTGKIVKAVTASLVIGIIAGAALMAKVK